MSAATTRPRPAPVARRVGYVIAIAVNAALLYLLNTNPGWEAIPLVTAAADQVIGLVNLSLVDLPGITLNPTGTFRSDHDQSSEKHTCLECEAKFYDLGKKPPVCPKCGTEFVPVVETPKPKRNAPKPKPPAAKKADVEDDDEDDDDIDDIDDDDIDDDDEEEVDDDSTKDVDLVDDELGLAAHGGLEAVVR